jgi:predicted MFS family arabinose efflux permease
VSAAPAPSDPALTRAIFLMACAAFASGASLRISDPLLPQVASDFGTSIGAASTIVTAYAIPYGMTQTMAGLIGDRLGKCQAVALACGLSCLLVLLCAAAQSVPQLALARLVSAPGAAIIVPLGMAYVGDVVPYERRQTLLARFLGGQMGGMLAGQVAGGVIGDHFGWRSVFLVLAVFFATASLGLVSQFRRNPWVKPMPHPGGVRPGFFSSYRRLILEPWPRFVCTAVFLEGAIFFGGFTYVSADQHARFGLSFSVIGLVIAGFGVGSVAYALVVHRLVNRFRQPGLVLGGGLFGSAGFLVLAFMPAWELAPFACLVLGFGYYMLHNTLQTHATQMLPDARGTAVAGFSSALFLGASAGVALAAPLFDRAGAVTLFVLTAILWTALAAWCRWRLAARAA